MMGIARLTICGAVAFVLQGVPPPLPPFPPPQTTFRSGTALVEVDVIALDKQGNFVPGLHREDLELLEDGKPQKIQQFFMVTHLGSTKNSVSQFASEADHGARRVFIMLFDEGHLANESLARVKRGAEDFIRDQMGPEDVGGVFVGGGMFRGRLTTDKGELLAGVRSVKPAFDNRQALLAPFRAFPRIPSEHDAARIADGARELVNEIGVKACIDDPIDCQTAGGLQQVENLIQQKARLYIRQARTLASSTVRGLQTVAAGLSRIPGRKTVMFMTEGFFSEDSRGALETIAAQAARGGTTIYTIDGRGLIGGTSVNPDAVSATRARSTVFDTADDGPNILTAGTGGFMVRNIDDMSRAFGLIVRDTSTYYVIGYQPENSTMDGKYRKIDVKSKIAGLKVRARKGYAAVALPPQEMLWKVNK